MNDTPTPDRILDAAERLFAERGGADGASMRELASAAGVPLSLLSYHFGSKEALYRAVFTRRSIELSEAREMALAEALAQPKPTTEAVVAALVGPSVRQRFSEGIQGAAFALLTAREATDPREATRGVVAEHFDPSAARFIAALSQLYPKAPPHAVAEVYLFMIGALVMTLAAHNRVSRLVKFAASGPAIDPREQEASAMVERLAAFCAAGVRAALAN